MGRLVRPCRPGLERPAARTAGRLRKRRDLHAALQAAGIGGPYVVAGHSYGGLVVRAFTDLYPDEVAGMALIDASHPEQWANIPMSRDGRFNGGANLVTGFLARLGVVRIFQLERAIYQGLPGAAGRRAGGDPGPPRVLADQRPDAPDLERADAAGDQRGAEPGRPPARRAQV